MVSSSTRFNRNRWHFSMWLCSTFVCIVIKYISSVQQSLSIFLHLLQYMIQECTTMHVFEGEQTNNEKSFPLRNTHPMKYCKLIQLTFHQSYFKSIFRLLLRSFREVFTTEWFCASRSTKGTPICILQMAQPTC